MWIGNKTVVLLESILQREETEMPEFRDFGKDTKNFEEEVAKLRDRMGQLLANYSREAERSEPLDEVGWTPPLDVLENKDDIIVRADMPGMNPDEIDLSISGDLLHIKGERKLEVEREDENYHTIERGRGKFDRKVKLPTKVDVNSIKASYKDGILTVKLPKMGMEKMGKVEIKPE